MLAEVGCLALVLYFEARSEPFEGKMFVAETVLNRVESKRYPNNVCDVVIQKQQFSFFNDVYEGKPLTIKEKQAWIDSINVAYEFYVNKPKIHNSCNYARYDVSNRWTKKMDPVIKVGAHIWYDGGC